MFELRAQRPFTQGHQLPGGLRVRQRERVRSAFDDLAQYQVLQTRRRGGLGMAADRNLGAARAPHHRRRDLADADRPRARVPGRHCRPRSTTLIGGWQYTAAARFYSGRPLLFTTSYVVNGNPKLDNPTRDRWFDTSVFARAGHVHAAQQPVVLRRAERPERVPHRHDADEDRSPLGPRTARGAHRGLQRVQPDRRGTTRI